MEVELVQAAFDPAAHLSAFTQRLGNEGGVVSFTGRARGETKQGIPLHALILESYRGATLASMKEIAADAHSRFAITHSHVVHRAGRIEPGEPIVFVATAAQHRKAAFEAADYLMDRLKTEAVFWKREKHDQGHAWIEPTDADFENADRWRNPAVSQ